MTVDVTAYQAPLPSPSTLRAPGMAGYCPWAHLAALEGVSLTWHQGGDMGETDFETRTVSLRLGLTATERRATLTHELAHVERGPAYGPPDSVPGQLEEHVIEMTTLGRLIPAFVLDDLPELVARHGEAAACDFLGIDEGVLHDGLRAVEVLRNRVVR